MTRRNPSRGRRTQRRAEQHRTLNQGREPARHLDVPEHIRRLADDLEGTDA